MASVNTPLGDPQGVVAAALADGSTVLHPHPALHIEERQMIEAIRVALIAEMSASGASLKYRGTWAAQTAYALFDIVMYVRAGESAGRLYRCNTAHTSSTAFNFTNFSEFATTSGFSDARYLIKPWAAGTQYVQYQPTRRPSDGVLVVCNSAHTAASSYDATKFDVLVAVSADVTPAAVTEAVSTKTSSYTLALADAGTVIEVDSTSNLTITIPPHSVVPIPVGSVIRVRQAGSAQVIVKAGGAVTIRTPRTLRTAQRWSTIRMHKRGPHDWALEDDISSAVTPPSTISPVTINFSTADHVIDPIKQFGIAVSGYTGQGGDIRYATGLQASSRALAPGFIRFAFKWDPATAKPLAGSHGGINDSAGAAAWVAGIKAAAITGAKIIGIIEGEEEMQATPSDATNIVNYSIAQGWGIEDWAIGNEPELDTSKIDYKGRYTGDGRVYGDLFCELGAAVKAAQPTAKLWGPTASSYPGKAKSDPATATTPGAMSQFFNDFLNATGYGTSVAALLDVLCWHKYLSGSVGADVSTATLMNATGNHYNDIVNAKTLINNVLPSKSATMKYSLNEYNIFFQPANGRQGLVDEQGTWYDERVTTAEGTVFIASALRHSIRATNNYFIFFADLAGPLGMWTRNPYDLNASPPLLGDNMGPGGLLHYPHGKPVHTPYSVYWGIAIYTGSALGIRRFGANIPAQPGHGIANLELQASSDNGGDIVIINKDEAITRRLSITTTGIVSQPVDIWQTARHTPWDAPAKISSTTISAAGVFEVIVPPMTVTRCVITP